MARYTDTQVVEARSVGDLFRLFRFLHRLKERGPRSVRIFLAITVERDSVFLGLDGARVVNFPAWLGRFKAESERG